MKLRSPGLIMGTDFRSSSPLPRNPRLIVTMCIQSKKSKCLQVELRWQQTRHAREGSGARVGGLTAFGTYTWSFAMSSIRASRFPSDQLAQHSNSALHRTLRGDPESQTCGNQHYCSQLRWRSRHKRCTSSWTARSRSASTRNCPRTRWLLVRHIPTYDSFGLETSQTYPRLTHTRPLPRRSMGRRNQNLPNQARRRRLRYRRGDI
jgi:hypothetical protein